MQGSLSEAIQHCGYWRRQLEVAWRNRRRQRPGSPDRRWYNSYVFMVIRNIRHWQARYEMCLKTGSA